VEVVDVDAVAVCKDEDATTSAHVPVQVCILETRNHTHIYKLRGQNLHFYRISHRTPFIPYTIL